MLYKELYLCIEELLAKKERVSVAIDGGAGSGKTTLASMLAERYGASVIHMDDFFLRPQQRTAERLAEPGGNFDRERMLSEVMPHLSRKEDFSYQMFDCSLMQLGAYTTVPASSLVIVEGSYSHHPMLRDFYDLRIFLSISEEKQRERILKRNGTRSEMFFSRWIPMENAYFEAFSVKRKADLVISV